MDKIAIVSLENDIWYNKLLYHFVAINKKGHVLHFVHLLPHVNNPFAPFWFLGKIKGISNLNKEKVLAESGRKIIWIISNITFITIIMLCIWIVLCIPWLVVWSVYPLYWNFKSLLYVLRKRNIKHR